MIHAMNFFAGDQNIQKISSEITVKRKINYLLQTNSSVDMRFNGRRRNLAGYVQLKLPILCTDVRFNQ